MWRCRYCHRIVEKNIALAHDLDKTIFKYAEFEFFANIANKIDNSPKCLIIDNVNSRVECVFSDPKQVFEFFYLEDIDKWVIKQGDQCLYKDATMKICDFSDEGFLMKFIFDGDKVGGCLLVIMMDSGCS